MPATATCARHPAIATHRCEGCEQPLCDDCVRVGHRLLFCRLCGERALPLAPGGAASTTERRRAAAADYRIADALGYPFRGFGAYVFWGFVVLWLVPTFAVALFGLFGILAYVVHVLLVLSLPIFLFAIASSTARGEDELPDWPAFDPWEAFASLLLFVMVAVISLVPLAILARVAGCGPIELLAGEASIGLCLLVLAVGSALAVLVWVISFGATATYHSGWLSFRVDLHAAAVGVAPREYLAIAGLVAALMAGGQLLAAVLSFMPTLGQVAGLVVQAYSLFVGAHLAGVYFRRHRPALDAIYLD